MSLAEPVQLPLFSPFPGRTIVREVAQKHGLSPLDLSGPRRLAPVVVARQEAMWRMRRETRLSFPQIGRIVGRDHSTVIYGIRAHAKRMGQG